MKTPRHFLLQTLTVFALPVASGWCAEEPSLLPPKYLGPPLAEHAGATRAFQGIPSMAVAPNGRLWADWYAGVTPGEDRNNYVVVSTSGDGGTTWREALVVDPDASGPVRAFDPELWLSPDGRLFVFWTQAEGHLGTVAGVWCVETSDPDSVRPRWSKPRRLTDGVMMCKPLVLSSGEWVLPASTWRETDNSARMVVSTDQGGTWTLRGACQVPVDARQFDEHMFVERRDGSLWLLVRTRYGIGESVSTDRGRTWPVLAPSNIPHTGSRFFIRRLNSGNLLLVKHGPMDKATGRSHLTAYVSGDDGKTWGGGLLLDERKGVSYPDGQQSADGLIRIVYDFDRTGDRHILMAVFREEDAAAGRDASGAVRLRVSVNKVDGKKTPGGAAADGAAKAFLNSIGIKLMPVAPGSFLMGQDGPAADYQVSRHPEKFDDADWDERPAHRVTIGAAFHIGATEVTLGQYRRFKPEHLRGKGADDDAATQVTWNDAVAFCEWLSKKEGKPYRLPTEAEWEYACRAGTVTLFHTGDTLPAGSHKWVASLGYRDRWFHGGKLPPEFREYAGKDDVLRVAQTSANAWGLSDMHGNAAEWCADWYGPYEADAQVDPLGRSDGDFRVIRGGSHSALTRLLRSANRSAWLPGSANDRLGFRIVQGEPPKGHLRPPPAPPLHAQNVDPQPAGIEPPATAGPFFSGPNPYVKIPPGAAGPLFVWHNHSASIAECPNGDLLAVWYSCVDEGGSELCDVASRLRRGATEWEPASPFWDGADVNDHAPKIWWDSGKTLYHFAQALGENIMRTSTDNGVTWSKAQRIQPAGEFGNQLLRLRDGTLVLDHDSPQVSLVFSRDGGRTWESNDVQKRAGDFRAGGRGFRYPGIHAPMVELADGRIMALSRSDRPEDQEKFGFKTPASFTSDLGKTWTYEATPFPAISSVQRAAMIRLREGPILLCSFTDQWRDWKNRRGLVFEDAGGNAFTGYGLFAALSYDDGKTWPVRRLLTPGGGGREVGGIDRTQFVLSDTMAEPCGYLAATQTRDGNVQLISSKNHYTFNLDWLKQLPVAPKK